MCIEVIAWNVIVVFLRHSVLELTVIGSADRCPDSSRRCCARTADNIDCVYKMVLHTKISRQEIIFTHCT